MKTAPKQQTVCLVKIKSIAISSPNQLLMMAAVLVKWSA